MTQSDEPLLKSHECRIAVAEIEGLQLRIRHLNEEFDLIEEELKELRSDLGTLNDIDVRELESKLMKVSTDIKLYQMKVSAIGGSRSEAAELPQPDPRFTPGQTLNW